MKGFNLPTNDFLEDEIACLRTSDYGWKSKTMSVKLKFYFLIWYYPKSKDVNEVLKQTSDAQLYKGRNISSV